MTGLALLRTIAEELGAFTDRLVFTGGLVLPLYLTRPPSLRLRPTRDADVVVACTSHRAWLALQGELGEIGVRPLAGDPEAPICRMRTAAGHLLDLMPTDPGVLGFGNRWFGEGYARSIEADVGARQAIRVFPAALYAAAKVEAYRGRGRQDPWLSHDLEDLLTLLACRPGLAAEARAEAEPLRGFLREAAQELLALERLDEIIQGSLREPEEPILAMLESLAGAG